ncbi:hypothetical protein HDU97_006864 [Phlyctochytrium planicorne]|nr:hypothetical protein HDU97_006864 [Phlyctochytrium planicorne]
MSQKYARLPTSPPNVTAFSDPNMTTRQGGEFASSRAKFKDVGSHSGQAQRLPKRTTKTSQKLALFPDDGLRPADGNFLEETYLGAPTGTISGLNPLPLPHVLAKTAKGDFSWRFDKASLPRATAYCTANSYKMDALFDYLLSMKSKFHTEPQKFDEAIYTPFRLASDSFSDSTIGHGIQELALAGNADISDFQRVVFRDYADTSNPSITLNPALNASPHYKSLVRRATTPELFFFDYGVVVMWGLDEAEELQVLKDISRFEDDSIDHSDVEAEKFHFFYSQNQQPRIFNDIITLVSPTSSIMIKLTISHAFSQSVKLTLFEGLIEETIESTKQIPSDMAATGKIHMHRKAINQKIGQLFVMRINVNLVSNVLDTPEIFWSEPAYEPL